MSRRPEPRRSRLRLAALLAAAGLVTACARTPARAGVSLEARTIPEHPVLDQPFVVEVRVHEGQEGTPVSGATVEIIGQMNHPGMAPAVAAVSEPEPGLYRGAVTMTMAGTWTVQAAVSLPDGRRAGQRLELEITP